MFLKEVLTVGKEYFICDVPTDNVFYEPKKYILQDIVYEPNNLPEHYVHLGLDYMRTYVFNNNRRIEAFLHDSPLNWEYNNDVFIANSERNMIHILMRLYDVKAESCEEIPSGMINFLETIYETKPELVV